MHNTLDLFYNYLAVRLLDFFANPVNLAAGDRYYLYLEREEDLDKFTYALFYCNEMISEDFVYQHNPESKIFETKQLVFGHGELIISSNAEATENFLTTLRNQVAGQSDIFKGKSILILFSGKLDSLIGGSGDLTKAGMPFNYEFFSAGLKKNIQESMTLSFSEKIVLTEALNKKVGDLRLDNASIFDLATIIGIVNRGKIEPEDYSLLGIFPHQELGSINDAKLIRTLNQNNNSLYEAIEFSINYGDATKELEKRFTNVGVRMVLDGIEDGSWKLIDYADLIKTIPEKDKNQPILYKGIDLKSLTPGVTTWDRPNDPETNSGNRQRNLLIFNPFGSYPINVLISFDSYLKGEVKPGKNFDGSSIEKSGRHLKLTINEEHYNSDVLAFEYGDGNNSNRYKFKVWCLNVHPAFLEAFSANYLFSDTGALLINDQEQLVFNQGLSITEEVSIGSHHIVEMDEDRQFTVQLLNEQEEEEIQFFLRYRHLTLDILVRQKINLPKPVKGWEIWQNKRLHRENYRHTYNPESNTLKLSFRNEEFTVRDAFRENLLLEIKMMGNPALAWSETEGDDNILEPVELAVSAKLRTAYIEYFDMIAQGGFLPSLVFQNPELRKKAEALIQIFLGELDSIVENQPLKEGASADLIRLGTIIEDYKTRMVKFTPLHPLMIAFQLELNDQVDENSLYEAMLKKLTPLNLLPFLNWENPKAAGVPHLYAGKENNHSPEWMYFSHDLQFKQFGGREFIRALVNSKIAEFVDNFGFLFNYDNRTPLKINVYNMGDCLQVLQGIFDYYKDQVSNRVNPFDLRPIDLYIKGSDHYVTTFEKMAHLFDKEDIEKAFLISANSKLFDFEDLLNAFRSKVRFFADGKQKASSYAHLTFYQFNNDSSRISYRDSNLIPSGVSLNGLMSDVPSHYQDETYVTGFGTRFDHSQSSLSRLVRGYNALAKVSFSKHPYKKEEVVCTLIDSSIKHSLNDLYDHSQWVTFVDPHFDLSFFKGEDDVIIVHYSDQYSSASGFDAITVTRKSQQYRYLLQQILRSKEVTYQEQDIIKLIDLYNAINGEWLLKLISKKDSNLIKEKLSLPSAVKVFLALYAHPEITWVPLSLEEILRVSGGAGLSKSEGLFSTKNLGAREEHCDDLLMVGIYELNGELHLQFLPVEVKIGLNASNVIKHAHDQVEKTYQLLYNELKFSENGFQQEFYRSFFAKLVLMSAGKMKFYEVWEGYNWDKVLVDYRERLMTNKFTISEHISQVVGHHAIIAFSANVIQRTYTINERGAFLEMFEQDGYSHLVKGIEEIRQWAFETISSLDKALLLANQIETLAGFEFKPDNFDPDKDTPDTPIGPVNVVDAGPEIEKKVETHGVSIDLKDKNGPIQIHFGTDVADGKDLLWFPTDTSKVMHTNTGIIGTMGTGKTQFTKSLITQLSREAQNNVYGSPIGILIFDYKGDYINQEFLEATGATVHKLFHLPYNPLAIDIAKNSMPLLPLHIASTLQETISNAFGLGAKQKAFLKEVIMGAYENKGIYKGDESTWTKVAPTISDICELYLEDEKMAIDSLHAALKQLYDFEIFQPDGTNTKSLFELIDGVTVINLSGYSPDIQNLVVAITLDAFYSQMQKNGHSKISGNFRQLTKMVLVDEADNFLSKNFSSLRKILKEGREFGVGTILSTQFLNHFSTADNEYDQYILTWIIHRVNDVKIKDVDSLFSITEKEQKEKLVQIIKKLEKHHSVVNLAGSKPILIEDMPFWKLLDES
jgi:DNA phosphorothioation-dependent restriction protein DptH